MLFPRISRNVMFGRPSKPSGIDPFRRLFLSRSFERLWQLPRSSGIGPISLFSFRMTVSSFWPAQRSCGIVPLREFEERSRIVRFMFCPSVAGMVPVKLFCQRFSTWCRHKAQMSVNLRLLWSNFLLNPRRKPWHTSALRKCQEVSLQEICRSSRFVYHLPVGSDAWAKKVLRTEVPTLQQHILNSRLQFVGAVQHIMWSKIRILERAQEFTDIQTNL